MTNVVPEAIRRFIDATNSGDKAAFLAAFTETGSLTDWGRHFNGRAEIARWDETDNIGVQSHLTILRIEEAGGIWHARISVRGNGYNGEGKMAFTLDGDRISRLVIS